MLGFALSFVALLQRTRAIENEAIAEQRAALLATDTALNRAGNGAVDESLLLLLDASEKFAPEQVPDKLKLALRDVRQQADQQRSFSYSASARAFHLNGRIVVFDPERETVFEVRTDTREQATLSHYAGRAVTAAATDDAVLFLDANNTLW